MREFKFKIVQKLVESGIDKSEALQESDIFIEHISGYSKKDYVLNPNLVLTNFQQSKITHLAEKRAKTQMPIQYILGSAYFMDELFMVNENTLIPRPETELLVKKTAEIAASFKTKISILDIGTGTGCIPIMLAKILNSKGIEFSITTCDISKEALKVAKKNALKHNVAEQIELIQSDLFNNIKGSYDIIVSNPPYIPIKEKQKLQSEVAKYEPPIALFANDEEGIEVYKRIIEESKTKLNPDGYILFELGINQYKMVTDIFKQNYFDKIGSIKDLIDIDRVIFAHKP